MNPSANSPCRWKIKELKSFIVQENTKRHLLPFVAITESWLKSCITDAQVHIPHYEVSRSDRNKRTGGGVILYSHEAIPLTECLTCDDETCQLSRSFLPL